MSSDRLFLFGDLTGEILPAIQDLSRAATQVEALGRFFQKAIARLRSAISRSPAQFRRRVPFFNSPLDLASSIAERDDSNPAILASLFCLAQLGDVIVYLESDPRALEGQNGNGPATLGICTGLIAALAVSCCRNLTELISIADEVVELAFRVGLEASTRSDLIDPSTESWSTLVACTNENAVKTAIDAFNKKNVTDQSQKLYISATGTSSLTISGPRGRVQKLLAESSVLKGIKSIALPISAAFHASHLEPISRSKMAASISQHTLERQVQHTLVSPHSGRPYLGATFSAVLVEVVNDILQAPISFQSYTDGLSHILLPTSALVAFGPVNSTRAIKQALDARGVEADLVRGILKNSGSSTNSGAVAIVGMAARLPGSETLEEFWKVLEDGRDLHEKIRPDRFNVDTHCDPTGKRKNTSLTPYGVFIDRPGYFDTRLFNMSPREAAQTDPQQRLLLLTTYEALEMAGYSPNRTPSTNTCRTGSFIGQTSDDWREVNASQNVDTYFITGGIRAFGPGRLNYHFGWEGPSYSIDTACSSSAASIQLACSSLLAGECDMAVGGGANILTASDLFAGLSRGSFLSKTGGCKTFDNDADGYVRADAVGVVVLKRLDDALADRDNVLAVIRAAVTNHSAEAVSITHPHTETQERLFHAALNQAGVKPEEIDYAELHGTGTQAGDATETRSVTNVLARNRQSSNPLFIGTVKPNLGHGEAASGVTSLIRAIMMLRKNIIPPHVGIKGRINEKLSPLVDLNTHISFGKTAFLPRSNGDGKRRILVNNFDAAGGNTSMVIEDPPVLAVDGNDPRNFHIVAVSGKTANSMLNNSKKLLEYVRRNPNTRLEDVAYTTTSRRMHHPIRSAHAVSSIEDLALSLQKSVVGESGGKTPTARPPVVFLFTGQGSQYLGMASELLKTNAIFHEILEDCDRACLSLGFESFMPLITDDGPGTPAASPVGTQLAIVSVELALASWWKSLGLVPTAVLGHSLGEYPALCVSGVISLRDCLSLVGERARLMAAKCTPGTHSMLAIQAGAKEVEALIGELNLTGCEIACVNGPTATVVSGSVDEVSLLKQQSDLRKIKCTQLEVQFAFHSSQMDVILDNFAAVAQKIEFCAPSVPVASTVLGRVISGLGMVGPKYLVNQTRGQVKFLDALQGIKSMLKKAHSTQAVWVEVGPSPICLGLVKGALDDPGVLLPSLKKRESNWRTLASSVAQAFVAGLDIDWPEFHRPYESALRLLELPSYAFDLKNYWIQYEGDWALRKGELATADTPPSRNLPPTFSTTSLQRIESQTEDESQISVVFTSDASDPNLNKALRGHLVNGAGLCPSSVYADMAFTAAKYIHSISCSTPTPPMNVGDMEVHKPLLIEAGNTQQIIRVTATRASGSGQVEVRFSSQNGQDHQEHARCLVSFGDVNQWKAEWAKTSYLISSRYDHLVQSSTAGKAHKILRPMVYKLFSALVDYDTRYQGLQEVYMDSGLHEAAAVVKFNATDADGSFTYSPYWIDSLTHLSGFVLNGAENTPSDAVYISHGWKSLRIVGQLSSDKQYRSYVRMRETKARGVMAGDVYFMEGDEVIALCEELRFQKIQRKVLNLIISPELGSTVAEPRHPAKARNPLDVSPRIQKQIFAEAQPPIPSAATTSGFDFSAILDLVASEVGVDVSELEDDAVFADLGVDSLLSISITAKLGEYLSQGIPAALFTECLTVRDLRAHFSTDNEPVRLSWSDSSDAQSQSSSSEGSRTGTPSSRDSITPASPANFDDLFKGIIASEIGIEENEIDDDTPLSDFGVDSLLSLSIMAAIKAQTGRVLPSSFLMENPTFGAIRSSLNFTASHVPPPRELANALTRAQGKTPHPKAEAILLQGSANSTHPALFLLPDGSGSASSYVPLSRLNFPGAVYGLNSPFIHNAAHFTLSIPAIASAFLAEIQCIQPHGPYHLAGWSIGGTYAFEVASQLTQQHGERIESLTFIDAPCPGSLPPLPAETITLLEEIGAFDGLKDKTSANSSKIRDGVHAHFAGSVNALRKYRPMALPRRTASAFKSVTALWARHGVWETVGDDVRSRHAGKKKSGNGNAAGDWIMDPRTEFGANGWDQLLPGAEVVCEVVTGDHFSIMQKPGVLEVGRQLGEAVCRGL